MSLHASLDPVAQRALAVQRRRSTTTSIVAAILGVVLIGLCFALIALKTVLVEPVGFTVRPAPETIIDPPDRPTVPLTRNPTAPRQSAAILPVAMTRSPLSLPEIDTPAEDPGFPAGDGDDFAEGWAGSGGDGNFTPIDGSLRKRCSAEDRLAQLAAGGGTPAIEDHVVRALRYLKQTQAADGAWGNKHRAAMAGFSLLAYLGHCETPLSEEFGDSCLRAMVFLIDRAARQDGRFPEHTGREWPYEQAIATYALAEARTFCQAMGLEIPGLDETVRTAGQMIIDRQHRSGGWDYGYEIDSSRGGDLSITAWHIQALKACKLSGIGFDRLDRALRRSLDYVEHRQAADGSFGYSGTTPAGGLERPSLTGAGMLCLQMGGRAGSAPVRRGARQALDHSPFRWDSPDCDLYAHYYLVQAMFQRGGADWSAYQPRIRDSLTARQGPDGSWPRPGDGGKIHAAGAMFAEDSPSGRHYRTALATLMLEVYYRYLPATR
ncbi:prenyltransferase/squalene oxidase repeat-containing protein [Luteolibacter marinus]|uniref:prenyltransferase/squalene oxidase repeat-containing protein n=1 Tax=Luteolibacter marinus TaxID=2776705 RepID=UPI001865C558|nr:prenyltransferase/squalene oxidase repeat-containing protein [Luteolibacter marinus]